MSRTMKVIMVIVGILYLYPKYPLMTLVSGLSYAIYRIVRSLYRAYRKAYEEAYALRTALEKGENPHASLEDAFNIDLDRDWVGVGIATAEAALLSGVLSKGER